MYTSSNGITWSESALLLAAEVQAEANFGRGVSLFETTLAVGAYKEQLSDDVSTEQGACEWCKYDVYAFMSLTI